MNDVIIHGSEKKNHSLISTSQSKLREFKLEGQLSLDSTILIDFAAGDLQLALSSNADADGVQ